MDMQKEREEFEAWFGNTICDLWCADNREVQMAWEAWQAAKASAQTKITDLEEHNYSLQDKMHDLNALVAVTKASAVPDGYAVVPKDPTEAMLDASRRRQWDDLSFPCEDMDMLKYKAMIEAAQEQS